MDVSYLQINNVTHNPGPTFCLTWLDASNKQNKANVNVTMQLNPKHTNWMSAVEW